MNSIESEPHPWQSAKDHFDTQVMPKLERYGKYIGASASRGDEDAKNVIKFYEILRRSFDPIFEMMLDESLNKWITKNPDLK